MRVGLEKVVVDVVKRVGVGSLWRSEGDRMVVLEVNEREWEDVVRGVDVGRKWGGERWYGRGVVWGVGKKSRMEGDGEKVWIEKVCEEIVVKGKGVERVVVEVVRVGVLGEVRIGRDVKEIEVGRNWDEEF